MVDDDRRPVQLANLNLNLLVALDALFEEQSVSEAAKRLNVTQSTISHQLNALRELFNDPLLTRKGRAMVLTPRAERLVQPLRDALHEVERAVQGALSFDPATSTRSFRIAMPDLTAATILPTLLRHIETDAPTVCIDVVHALDARLTQRMGEGEIDLVMTALVGGEAKDRGELRDEVLYSEGFVCIVRKGHPVLKGKSCTLGDLQLVRHVTFSPVGKLPSSMGAPVREMAAKAFVGATVPYLLALPGIVRQTDCLATIPAGLSDMFAKDKTLRIMEAPPELGDVIHGLRWHERFSEDQGNQWLRKQIRQVVEQRAKS